MLKNVKLGLLALAMGATMVACQNEGENTTDTAEAPAVQPVANENNSLTNNQAAAAPAGPTTTITFDESEYNFGTVDAGEVVEHTYTFTNTGSEPLVISNAKGSCGCTVPDWPKEPVMPGQTGEIRVKFDSKNKNNAQKKKVTITANTEPAQTFLYISGQVNGVDKPAQPVQVTPQAQ
jgi:outer membrane biosynthesis protein TonB